MSPFPYSKLTNAVGVTTIDELGLPSPSEALNPKPVLVFMTSCVHISVLASSGLYVTFLSTFASILPFAEITTLLLVALASIVILSPAIIGKSYSVVI